MQIHDDPWKYCEEVLLWDFTSPQKEAWCWGILVLDMYRMARRFHVAQSLVSSFQRNLKSADWENWRNGTHQSVQQWLSVVISFRSHFFGPLRTAKDMSFACYQRAGYGWIVWLLETMWNIGLRVQSVLANRPPAISDKLPSLKLTAKAPENRPGPKRKQSSSNHPFSFLANVAVSFRGGWPPESWGELEDDDMFSFAKKNVVLGRPSLGLRTGILLVGVSLPESFEILSASHTLRVSIDAIRPSKLTIEWIWASGFGIPIQQWEPKAARKIQVQLQRLF